MTKPASYKGSGSGLERDVVNHGLVLIGDVGDLSRQGEDHMIVRHRQEFGLARGEPLFSRRPLALGTVAIAAEAMRASGEGVS